MHSRSKRGVVVLCGDNSGQLKGVDVYHVVGEMAEALEDLARERGLVVDSDESPLYDECPVCSEPIWAEELQVIDGGIHSECYADQLDALLLFWEEKQESELEEYDYEEDQISYFNNWRFRG